MGVIFVSDRAKEVWKYILGISAVIGALIFLYFNFINMFAYLSYLPPFITVFYVVWIAVSLFIMTMDLSLYWKLPCEVVLTIVIFVTFIIEINHYNDSEERMIYLNLGWGIVSLVIHTGLLYLMGYGCYSLKKFIIGTYVQKRINRKLKTIDNIIADNLAAESIATSFLKDTYYLSNFIKLINSLHSSSNSNHLRDSFLKNNEEEYQRQYNLLVAKVPESYKAVFPQKYKDLLCFSTITNNQKSSLLQIKKKFENATSSKEVTEIETELYQYITSQQIQLSKGDEK